MSLIRTAVVPRFLALSTTWLALSGCALSQLDAQWVDGQAAGTSFAGSKVLVVCDAAEPTVRRICEDQLALQLRAAGLEALSSDATAVISPNPAERNLAAAKSLGAQAIFHAVIFSRSIVTQSSPMFTMGMESGRWRRGWGMGMDFPYEPVRELGTAYSSDNTLSSGTTGKAIWSGKVSTVSSQDISQQIAELSRTAVASARKAGFL